MSYVRVPYVVIMSPRRDTYKRRPSICRAKRIPEEDPLTDYARGSEFISKVRIVPGNPTDGDGVGILTKAKK